MTRGMWKGQVSSDPVELQKEEKTLWRSRRSPHLPSLRPPASGSPPRARRLHEPVADGAEMFGEPDGEDDVGDEEEGAAAQAEPESVLQGESTGSPLSCAGRRSPRGLGSLEVAGSGVSGLLMVPAAPNSRWSPADGQGQHPYPGVGDAVA